MCATEHTRYLEEHHHRGCPSEIDQLQIPTPSRARAWFSGSDFMIVVLATYVPAGCTRTQICYNMCTQDDPDYEFFGLQFGFECWCSKTFSETAGGDCTTDCSLNADEDCGGYDAILAFKIN